MAARGYIKSDEFGCATPLNSSSSPNLSKQEDDSSWKFDISTYTDESNVGEIDLLFGLVVKVFLVVIFECDVSSLSTSYSLKVVVLPS